MINLKINNIPVTIEDNETILHAAKKVGIKIPTLCHFESDCFHKEARTGSCRICVVEVEGRKTLAPSCCTPVSEGMKVKTNSLRAITARRTVFDLLMSDHPKDCLVCQKNGDCELQILAGELGLHKVMYTGERHEYPIDISNQSIVRDMNKCIMCRRCEVACNEMQTVGVLSAVGRGFGTVVKPTLNKQLADTKCTFCGHCVLACPVGALTEFNVSWDVWKALNDPTKTVIVQTAPAVRAALGEEFGIEAGTAVTGKLVMALRMLGFHKVFDTNFAADLTIMEEAHEFLERLKSGNNLPILTSCCPGWVKFLEHQFPDLLHIPSSAKSPQQMFGAIAKTYLAEKLKLDSKNIIVVSIMPCLAKKYEANREEFSHEGKQDVDYVLTTRELAQMIKEAGIAFNNLEDSDFDSPLGESSGASVIFGASGGVLEAALRTTADWITGEDLQTIDFMAVRGIEGTKEATINIAGKELIVAVTSGLGNTRKLLEKIRNKEIEYHAIEVMACPGGCLNGGGQPYIHNDNTILEKRKNALYGVDRAKLIRKSHQNPFIKKIYQEFLGEPGSKKAHELLHTHYTKRVNN